MIFSTIPFRWLICCIFLIFTFFTARSQPEEGKRVTSEIEEVTVYLNGAQINRSAQVNLQKGKNTLVFEGLSAKIRQQSIQVGSSPDVLVLSVKPQTNFLKTSEQKAAIQELMDKKENLTQKINEAQNQLQVYQEEEDLLKSNKQLGGKNEVLNVSQLQSMADFFRSRMLQIKEKQMEMDMEIKALNEELNKINQQLQELNAQGSNQTGEILVTVDAEDNTTGGFEFSYLVTGANWQPSYDIRVNNIDQPLSLVYKAEVNQNTGSDWEDVAVSLSTANPFQQGTKPDVTPWYLNFSQPRPARRRSGQAPGIIEVPDEEEISLDLDVEMKEQVVTTRQISRTTHFEYQIDQPYDITSGSQGVTIDINKIELGANYEYYCAPKYDRNAYLTAHITGWDKYNLLSGNVNLFFEGKYIGNSHLNMNNLEDTLTFSLGQDKNIVVNRKKSEDFTSKQFIGGNKQVTKAWEIEVRNTKEDPIKITVEDQFPISQNQDIQVERLETSGGQVDNNTGKVKWDMQLDPAETHKVSFKYAVKYPKGKNLPLE